MILTEFKFKSAQPQSRAYGTPCTNASVTPHLALVSLGHPPPELVVLGHDEVPLALVQDLPGAHLAADGLVGVAILAPCVV